MGAKWGFEFELQDLFKKSCDQISTNHTQAGLFCLIYSRITGKRPSEIHILLNLYDYSVTDRYYIYLCAVCGLWAWRWANTMSMWTINARAQSCLPQDVFQAAQTLSGILWSSCFPQYTHVNATSFNNARQKSCSLKLSVFPPPQISRPQTVAYYEDWSVKGPIDFGGTGGRSRMDSRERVRVSAYMPDGKAVHLEVLHSF